MSPELTKKIDYNTSITMGKDKVVFTRFNGKSDEPLNFKELHEKNENNKAIKSDTSTADFIREFKLTHMANQSMIAKPLTLANIVHIILLVVLTINGILLYYDYSNLGTITTNILAPLLSSNAHQGTLDTVLLNQSTMLHQLLLRCINNQSV